MAPQRDAHVRQLPLVPESILRRFRVLEKHDTRFRSCARLLQALWRESQGLPIGIHQGRDGRHRRLGSLISTAAADAGRNFLSPAIAHLVHREVAYQERGALIERRRLYGNLLSSQPLAFNLFAPLRFDLRFAAKVIRRLLPHVDAAKILHVQFEHSPGRLDPALTGDRSSFDVAIIYERADGERGLIGIEMKYSESGGEGAQADPGPRFNELAVASELYRNPCSAVLRTPSLQQLAREHLLTFAAVRRGDFAQAHFVLIAPRDNHLIQQAARLYSSHLLECEPERVPFINLELECVIEALGWCGQMDYACALHTRYLDWLQIDGVIEEALRANSGDWAVVSLPSTRPIALVTKVA